MRFPLEELAHVPLKINLLISHKLTPSYIHGSFSLLYNMKRNLSFFVFLSLFLSAPLVQADSTCVIYKDLYRSSEIFFAGWSYNEASATAEAFDRCARELTASVCRGSAYTTKCSGDDAHVADWTCVVYTNLYRDGEEFYAGWSGSKTMALEYAIERCSQQYDGATCKGSQFSSHCSGRY
jgi:hypothetical protein